MTTPDTTQTDAPEVNSDVASDAQRKADLLERARDLNLRVSPNIGLETLRTKVNNAIQGIKDEDEDVTETGDTVKPVESNVSKKIRMAREAKKLARVRISCHNPLKKSTGGEYKTVQNSYMKPVTKYVQFNVPTHVPEFLVNIFEKAEYVIYVEERNAKGMKIKKPKRVKEYVVERLPALTQEELDKLAARQRATNAID